MAFNTPAPVAPAPANAVQEINQRLGQLAEKLGMNNDRLDRVVDRAFGPTKQAGEGSTQPRAVPNGEIAALTERLDELSAMADRQAGIISRIDGIV